MQPQAARIKKIAPIVGTGSTLRTAAPIFLGLAALLLAGAWLFLANHRQQERALTLSRCRGMVAAATDLIASELREPITTLRVLANHDIDLLFYGHPPEESIRFLTSIVTFSPSIAALQYLDNTGAETLRVERVGRRGVLVPHGRLANLSGSEFLRGVSSLHRGGIHVERFQPSGLRGEPEIRLATPAYGSMDEHLGYIAVSYRGSLLLDVLEDMPREPGTRLMLLDEEGYWLHGGPPGRQWGFLSDAGRENTLGRDMPEVWREVSEAWEASGVARGGVFASTTTCVTDVVDNYTGPRTASGAGYWKVVCLRPEALLRAAEEQVCRRIAWYALPALAVAAGLSLLLGGLRSRSRRAEAMALKQMEANSRFVPREFLGLLHKDALTEVSIFDHVQITMTVLFTDIRSYTKISESMPPQQVLAFLNGYYQVIDPIINEEGGFVDAFIGDAVMALFARSPEDALRAAVRMRRKLATHAWSTPQGRHSGLDTGIGLHCGELTLGTVGTDRRMQTTAIGDSVNLAARVESATKIYGVQIIVTDGVRSRLEHPESYRMRLIDRVRLKGKQEVVELYEVFDADPPETARLKAEGLHVFEEAMRHYQQGDFDRAQEAFSRCATLCPEDTIPPIYLRRCNTLRRVPPGEGWTGVSSL